ncbi:unnamed protein product [marine sediment metagenome]|uniref:Uncharacterized protein n=1 Tax=marine sediment metagenome TaxID=412755 RepID=X1DQ87_9ZZZZ
MIPKAKLVALFLFKKTEKKNAVVVKETTNKKAQVNAQKSSE